MAPPGGTVGRGTDRGSHRLSDGVWWIMEVIPLAATALVLLVVFPLAGVESAAEVSVHYMHRTIEIFMG